MMYNKKTGIKGNARGSIWIGALIFSLVIAFVGLLFGLVNIYKESKKATVSPIQEVRFESDPEQQKLMETLTKRLNSVLRDNTKLSDSMKGMTNRIRTLEKAATDKDAQINFLIAERARLESSIKDKDGAYSETVSALTTVKDSIQGALDKERLEYKKTALSLNQDIKTLKRSLERTQSENEVLDESIAELRSSRLVKETARMHFNLANHFLKSRNHELAIKEYKRAVELYPGDAETHYNLALAYDIYTKDDMDAVEHYKKYLELNPGSKNKKVIQERIVSLSLAEAASIGSTFARRKGDHELVLDSINPPPIGGIRN